uniref:Muscarinic acetylcholine receptor n=1 Tax=Oncorhynchus tshawytscha TaxID=74940 RepID=A0AAZ3PWW2_ONCTS
PAESISSHVGYNSFCLPGLFSTATVEVVFIVLVAGSLSLVTVIGNILVMLSIKVNRNLQTVNNYFLFSLACADLIIGLCSMNLYTVYIVIGYWPLGPVVCDLWLALDYVVSNASVMNLLIISFDRYFCVTKPLSYPVKRTTKMAGMMIAAAWVLSFILWAPAILFWQFIVGGRTFFSNAAVTFGTAIAAFYLPVIIMVILYIQISIASKSRVKKETRKPSGPNPEALSHEQARASNTAKPINNNLTAEDTEQGTTQATDDVANQHEGKLQNGKGPSTTANCNTELVQQPTRHRQNHVARKIVKMTKQPPKKKKAPPSREKKVTRTIMAILVAFVATWTPYNVMVLINTFCSSCIPSTVWTIGYWLCYINSTINPACYALCNVTFKKTFKHLLLCQYKNIRSAR